jgi:uncharacterized alkaline shock family protein YloU
MTRDPHAITHEGNAMTDAHNDRPAPKSDRAEVSTTIQLDETTEVRGTVRIAPAVLIQLIETTVLDITGVVALTTHRRRKVESDDDETRGKSFDDGKVRVTVDGDQIDADVSITVRSGTNISRLTDQIRERVGVAAGRMLGMTVRTVDIYVDDIITVAE